METARRLPKLDKTDDQLGLTDVNKVIPDTWNNIAWVLQNSIEVFKEQILETRKLVEQIKKYAIDSNIKLIMDTTHKAERTKEQVLLL